MVKSISEYVKIHWFMFSVRFYLVNYDIPEIIEIFCLQNLQIIAKKMLFRDGKEWLDVNALEPNTKTQVLVRENHVKICVELVVCVFADE